MGGLLDGMAGFLSFFALLFLFHDPSHFPHHHHHHPSTYSNDDCVSFSRFFTRYRQQRHLSYRTVFGFFCHGVEGRKERMDGVERTVHMLFCCRDSYIQYPSISSLCIWFSVGLKMYRDVKCLYENQGLGIEVQ